MKFNLQIIYLKRNYKFIKKEITNDISYPNNLPKKEYKFI